MSRLIRIWLASLLLLLPQRTPADELRAGAAQRDITPPAGLPMWGYGARHDEPSAGVLDPLSADAVVLTVGDRRLALVGLDMGRAPTRKSMATIRARVRTEASVEHVIVVGSHTHHGPVVELDNLPSAAESYVRRLEMQIADAIIDAAKHAAPARIAVGHRPLAFNRNRQSKLPDKPVDPELVVVRVDETDGTPIATLVNFAAHPTMIDARVLKYSADYPGHMKRLVRQERGGVCVFLQGASGDLSANSGEHSGPEAFGSALGREVVQVAREAGGIASPPALQVREEDFHFPQMRIDLGNPLVRAAYSRAFFPALIDFYADEYKDGVRPHLTVALVSGEIGFVAVSGEMFANHSVRLKNRARMPHLLFLGYANDYQQYFPTIEAAAEGGYGADPAVSPVEIGAGERICDRALFHLFDMRGAFKRLPF